MERPSGLFRGSEKMRMLVMCGTLAMLGILIAQWRPSRRAAAPEAATAAETAPKGRLTEADLSKGPIPDDLPNTDLDYEEREHALAEFEAVEDRTAHTQKEDMPTYERLLKWSEHLNETVPFKRTKKVYYQQLVNDPEKYRGVLMRLDLHVFRVLEYDMHENGMGLTKAYEIWGVSKETGVNMYYVAVTAHLPPGMPTGPLIGTQATIYGYFFKSMSYLEAGAKPGSAFRPAPVLIGRVLWPINTENISRYDETHLFWIGAGAVVVVIVGLAAWRMLGGSGIRKSVMRPPTSTTQFGEWLDQRHGADHESYQAGRSEGQAEAVQHGNR